MPFQFRKIAPAEYPRMLTWLQLPHVKRWWDDGDDTLAKVAAHYGDADSRVDRYILWQTSPERAIGYFQCYQVKDGSLGIDQFIGEPDCLNRGVGTETIRLFIDFVREKYGPVPIVLDPVPENTHAIRCYEKVGFKHVETIPSTDKPGTMAYLMRFI